MSMHKKAYYRGIYKTAWFWNNNKAPQQGAPTTTPGKTGFLSGVGNTFTNIGNKIKNIGTNLANLGEADHAWGATDHVVDFFRNPFGLRNNTMDQDTGLTYGQKKQIATGQGSLFQGTSQYNDAWRQFLIRDTQKRNAVRADIDNTIEGFKRPQPEPAPVPQPAPAPQPAPTAPSTQAPTSAPVPQPAATTGATAQPAPKPAPVARPAVQTTQTAKQHADNIAKGKSNIMVNDQVDNVWAGYEQQLRSIDNAIAGIKNGEPNNDAIAATGGALSPTRKTMDTDTYQTAKDPNSPETQADLAELQAQKAQIQKNMKRLGRSSDQVRAARASGSDAKAQQDYAKMTQDVAAWFSAQRQKPATPTAPVQTPAATGTAPTAAPAKTNAPAVQPGVRPATSTGQPAANATATGTVPPSTTGAPTSVVPKQLPQRPVGTARRSISKTYDTTAATNGHASYTRNGITYLHFDNAADAQKALGTNNVMAMTRGKGDNKKLYWAPVSATKNAKPVGSYAQPQTNKSTKYKVRTLGRYQ